MTAFADDFDFFTVGTGDRDFTGYNSDSDPTTVLPQTLVEGSKNVYKKNRGNISVRPGLKRYLAQDASDNGIASSYEWQTSFGATRIIRVLEDGQWQVLYNDEWMTVDTFDKSRFVFTPWWNTDIEQGILVMVNGSTSVFSWTGGIKDGTGSLNAAGMMATGNTVTTAMTASVLVGDDRIVAASNTSQGSDAHAAFVFIDNPANDDLVSFTVSNNAPFDSASITIQFKTSLSGISSSGTTGYVLIGASKEATMTNLLAFFASPGSDTATQIGIDNATAISGLGLETYARVDSLSTEDGTDWTAVGFTNGAPATGSSFVSNGTVYSYTLVGGQYLINVSGVPAEGSLAIQSTYEDVETVSDSYTPDFCATVLNQVIYGSYTSSIVYFSFTDNYLQVSQTSQSDLIAGDPDHIVLDELPRGVIVVNESAYIPAGSNAWYICTPNTPLPQPQTVNSSTLGDRYVIIDVQKKVGAAQSAALAHEFLGSIADTILYLGQDHQLRIFGTFKDIFSTKYPTVSLAIKKELIDTDFTGGQLRAVGDNIYLVAPVPGKTFIYQQRDDVDNAGNVISERLWQPPFDWNISRIAVIDDVEYGYSNQSPETYQLWETGQYHDDTPSGAMPYECVLRLAYWQNKDRTHLGDLDKVFVEGYMPANTQLTATMRWDYLGATGIQDIAIGTQNTSPTLYQGDGRLIGDQLVGQELIGGATGLTGLPKFRAIPQFNKKECFEYQIELSSSAADSQWEVVCIGTNGSEVVNNPPYLLRS